MTDTMIPHKSQETKETTTNRTNQESVVQPETTGRRSHRGRRPTGAQVVAVGSRLLVVVLGGLAAYLWVSPLPALPVSDSNEGMLDLPSDTTPGNPRASLDTCLRLVKTRELFRPSVPIPNENRVGKSTAQQLAQRLQFLGTVGGTTDLAALVFIPERGPGTFRAGDRVAEFVLKDVKQNLLVLELGDEEVTLKR